jgi:cellulose synthase/poly-beta-1,6-N-acetylglucosamine synthase-like glycosyltransferase
MSTLEIAFWAAASCVLYTYALYPLLLGALARWRARPVARGHRPARSVTIVVAVRDEEVCIDRRLRELTRLIVASGACGEVVVVSDGSADGTAAVARGHTKGPVRVLELPARVGKAAALTAGCTAAVGDILVFADVRQSWAPDALALLLENFADPAVGAVSGNLVVASAPGVQAGVGLYRRFEKWLRHQEGLVWSMVGATGAISAVRRELFRPIPPGTILDDVYWPLQVALQGFRVVLDPRARAHDRLPERTRDEFRRKVRTLSGNLQLLTRLPAALLPWRNPVWFQLVSHKLMRLAVPWALLAVLALSDMLPGPGYRAAFWGQVLFYLAALAGIAFPAGARLRPVAAAASFVVLNAAAWLAFWVWASGRTELSWAKVRHSASAAGGAGLGAGGPAAGLETAPAGPARL